MKFYEHLFSIRNKDSYKLLRILGIKVKLKIRREIKYSSLWEGKEGNFLSNNRMKIAFYVGCPNNRSERYRVDNIIDALERRGIIADKYYETNIAVLKGRPEYDLLVVFRSGDLDADVFTDVIDTIKNFRSSGKPVIYDVDDFILQEGKYKPLTVNNVRSIIKLCSAVTTTTMYLAKLLSKEHENTHVIRNTINYQQYAEADEILNANNSGKSDVVKIVYQSGTSTHDKDFMECADALIDILDKYPNVEIHLIGPLNIDKRFNQYSRQVVRVKYMNYIDLLRYVSKMDINIAPLKISMFNNSKSELKIFEAALLKMPSVVSATDSYSKAIVNGHNGFVANDRREWFENLSKLIEDEVFRKNMAENAYREIVSEFYIDNEIEKVISLYKSLIAKA